MQVGVKARIEISITGDSPLAVDEIEDVRLLLQKEMDEKGTSTVTVTPGDGWEAHAREHYAES